MNIEQKIIEELDKIRPYLNSDGGDIKFIKFEDGIAYVQLTGSCQNCSFIDYTLKDGIEDIIISEIPEVIKVVNLKN